MLKSTEIITLELGRDTEEETENENGDSLQPEEDIQFERCDENDENCSYNEEEEREQSIVYDCPIGQIPGTEECVCEETGYFVSLNKEICVDDCIGVSERIDDKYERCVCIDGFELNENGDTCIGSISGLPAWAIALIVVGSILVVGIVIVVSLKRSGILSGKGRIGTIELVRDEIPIKNDTVLTSGLNNT